MDDATGMLEKKLAGRGELDLLSRSVEQLDAEFLFQLAH
jgi:hypothetical protein